MLRAARAARRVAAPCARRAYTKNTQLNKKAAKAAKNAKPGEAKTDKDYEFYQGVINSQPRQRPRLTEAEYARNFEIGAKYNKEMQLRHMRYEAGFQMMIDLQQHALNSLPAKMREHAESLDCPSPPLDRRIWTLTPPIPNFQPQDYKDATDQNY